LQLLVLHYDGGSVMVTSCSYHVCTMDQRMLHQPKQLSIWFCVFPSETGNWLMEMILSTISDVKLLKM